MNKLKQRPKLNANFYMTDKGNEPVRTWLLKLPKQDRQQIGEDIAYVQYKWPIGKPQVDHLSGPLWEVRTTLKTRIARVLFAVEDDLMLLLHGFIKKNQSTPREDITLALTRYKDWKNHHD